MMGLVTRVSAEEYAQAQGLEPVQIDGIPEGFSFRAPDIQIGDNHYQGGYVALLPRKNWSTSPIVRAETGRELLNLYNKNVK